MKQNFFDKKDFDCNNNPIYPTLGSEFQKTNVGISTSIFGIPCAPIFRQNGQLCYFGAIFAQKWILELEFQKSMSAFGISTLKISCEQFFNQNRQLWIFWPKFGEIAQLRAIFWFEYWWGCCRELGGGGWSWVEGVHGLVMSENKNLSKHSIF